MKTALSKRLIARAHDPEPQPRANPFQYHFSLEQVSKEFSHAHVNHVTMSQHIMKLNLFSSVSATSDQMALRGGSICHFHESIITTIRIHFFFPRCLNVWKGAPSRAKRSLQILRCKPRTMYVIWSVVAHLSKPLRRDLK